MYHIIWSLFFLLQPFLVAADYAINNAPNQFLPDYACELTQDSTDEFSLEKIKKLSNWYKPSFTSGLILPEPGTYWLRFTLMNNSTNEDWIIEFPDSHISQLDFYKLNQNGGIEKHRVVGYDYPFKNRLIENKNYFFDPNIKKGERAEYYVRIRSSYKTSFASYIRSVPFQFSYFLKEYYLLGFFYGMLFIMAMYNLFLYFFTREKIHGYYIFYIFTAMLYSLAEDGIGAQYVWPDFPSLNNILFQSSPFLFLMAFVLYSIEFLQLKKSTPLYITLGIVLLNLLTQIIIPSIPNPIKAFCFIIPFFYIYSIAFKMYKNGFRAVRFYLIGFSILLISFVIYFLRISEWIPTNLYTYYLFNYGIVLEVVLLSYSLGDRVQILKEEKEIAQLKIIDQLQENEKLKDKVNLELEEKVQARTSELVQKSIELENANQQLNLMAAELNRMNSILDKDNWELKKQVKEETRSRILQEKVSYEEYLEIFPNNHTCLSFLENLKWQNGYKCRKCCKTSFSKGEKPFTRRCSSCKYTESVTSGTLFHSVKFPLNKAFYIVYDTYDEKNRTSLDKLSERIELRRVTVWMFRKKVLEVYTKKNNLNDTGWESLIMNETGQNPA